MHTSGKGTSVHVSFVKGLSRVFQVTETNPFPRQYASLVMLCIYVLIYQLKRRRVKEEGTRREAGENKTSINDIVLSL